MSASPPPPDPYLALGVTRDADIDTIKKAHRKAVLKHHPDRFQDPVQQAQHRDDFESAQQAYELLADPQRRQRYDNQMKLNELRREKMMAEQASRAAAPPSSYTKTTYTARSAAPGTASSVRGDSRPEYRPEPRVDPRAEARPEPRFVYEDRSPDAYIDPRDFPRERDYDEPIRSSARKSDLYERKSPAKPAEKKEKPRPGGWERASSTIKATHMFKENVRRSREAKEVKERSKEEHARAAKARDKSERLERNAKESGARYSARVADYSDSDSDTVVAKGRGSNAPLNRPAAPSRSRREPSVEPPRKANRRPSPTRPRSRSPYMDDLEPDKWESHHRSSRDYIAESMNRPRIARNNSDADVFWAQDMPDRRSGSDSERQRSKSSTKPSPRNPRRTNTADEIRRPPMPTTNSSPANLKPMYVNVSPIESSYARDAPDRSERGREPPAFKRNMTDPVGKSRRDNAPSQGSKLKHGETNFDSGYGSNSSQQSPELRSESPPPMPRESRRPPMPSSTPSVRTYMVGKESGRVMPTYSDYDGDPIKKYLSPDDMDTHSRVNDRSERKTSRARGESEARTRSTRSVVGSTERRPSLNREGSSRGAIPKDHRKGLFGEIPSRGRGEGTYSRPVDTGNLRTSSYTTTAPSYSKYHDEPPSSYPSRGMPSSGRRASATAY